MSNSAMTQLAAQVPTSMEELSDLGILGENVVNDYDLYLCIIFYILTSWILWRFWWNQCYFSLASDDEGPHNSNQIAVFCPLLYPWLQKDERSTQTGI